MRSGKVRGPQLTAGELQSVLQLRAEVFVVEQKAAYLDVDGRDLEPGTIHYWLAKDDRVLAYLRVLTEPDGELRIGRVCTALTARGSGLGQEVMAAAVADLGDAPSVLDAQTYARAFYERFGYVAEGEEYRDEDDIPHITMRRAARTA
ncbi:GNAT family N-acetyltransferase [Actinocrispum wychmicini]|uniref:ElaA protein n=1 Tax=Actinocrispum wychmicini TaxID=1213861 RepID=A0A4R2JJZ7_9PSEU|nr:GNAT family N-acetyltransferase [Actinocrispum wychmicini]TCO56849.1 ElaA protein [Actinocrispum wychmicini]